MDSSHPNEVQITIEALKRAWAAAPQGPDLAALLSPAIRADDAALAEVLAADIDERNARGIAADIDAYLRALPELADRPEACRAMLMNEIARSPTGRPAEVAAHLKQRHPRLTDEIDLIVELCEALGDSVDSALAPHTSLHEGAVLGKYRLMARLGSGSFGEVWQARDGELDRYVALKVLHVDASRGENTMLERLMAEARAAAALNHENIVTIHAAGRLDGRFYIDSALAGDPAPAPDDPARVEVGASLEFIGSRPPGDSPALPPRRAAELMEAVCRGVAAAHARGILHRDIKPANILVTPSGRPLVADFGLSTSGVPARADAESAHTKSVSLRTESGRRIVGTPAYMSPEQADGERPTPISDVYSLGATLRFALTGAPPYRPTGRYSADGRWDVIAQVREARDQERQPFETGVPRELIAICEKAMARAPENRYPSASEMADELRAWLDHRPIKALPASALGVTLLWARRNSPVAILALAALLMAAIASGIFVGRLRSERDRAIAAEVLARQRLDQSEASRATSEATVEFLDGLLASPDPRLGGKDVTVLAALARADQLIKQRLKGNEAVEASVRTSIGHAYRALEAIKEARPHLERALEIRTRLFGPEHLDTLETRYEIASLLSLESRMDEAVKEIEIVAAGRRRQLGDDHPDTLEAIHGVGTIKSWTSDLDGAQKAFEEALERRLRVFGAEDPSVLSTKRMLAGVYNTRRKSELAEPLMREVMETHRRISEPTDVERLTAINDYGSVLRNQGRVEEALPLFREAYEGMKKEMPKGHMHVLILAINFVGALNQVGKGEEALPIALENRAVADETLGEENTFRWMTHVVYGDTLLSLGRFEEAEKVLLDAYARIEKVLGPDGRTTRTAASRLVKLYDKWGKPEEAAKYKPPPPTEKPPDAPAKPGSVDGAGTVPK